MKKRIMKACGELLIAGALTSGMGMNAKADLIDKLSVVPYAGVAATLNEYYGSAALKSAVNLDAVTAAPVISIVSGYTNLGVSKADEVNIREAASEAAAIVGRLSVNDGCEILQVTGEWSWIQSGKVTGFVKNEFLYTGAEANVAAAGALVSKATVNTATLKVREQANVESGVLSLVAAGQELQVLEDQGEWIKISINGGEGYVSKQYVTMSSTLSTAATMTELQYGEGVSDVRASMVEYAKQFLGNRYVWGGTSLTNGTDCSGFTMSIYKHFGISINRTSREQVKNGTRIDVADVKPGDLIFYARGGTIEHVVMYIGNGQVIHASSAKTGIKISETYYRTPVAAVRIIND